MSVDGLALAIHDQLDELLASRFQSKQLALRRREAGGLLHVKPVYLPGELATELLEEVLAHQLALKGAQHSLFDFLTRNGQPVRAYTATARAEASEVLA